MKTIDQYTIYCTAEQVRKALELGASLVPDNSEWVNCKNHISKGNDWYHIPTAEQMIGWLEEQESITEFDIAKWDEKSWAYRVHLKEKPALVGRDLFSSRPEATLAAIDAALDYLIKNKK